MTNERIMGREKRVVRKKESKGLSPFPKIETIRYSSSIQRAIVFIVFIFGENHSEHMSFF